MMPYGTFSPLINNKIEKKIRIKFGERENNYCEKHKVKNIWNLCLSYRHAMRIK